MAGVFRDHSRKWQTFSYVYPVISRRSHGVSVGINLNPNKVCNFDCVYCCVNRNEAPQRADVDLDLLREELAFMLDFVVSGAIWREAKFKEVQAEYRRLNDIALSGDGEPTAYPRFAETVALAGQLLDARRLNDVKLIVITNATLLDKPAVKRGLALLDARPNEIWAKLDGGTELNYRAINRSTVPFSRVLTNILACGRQRPIVLQSLFMKINGVGIGNEEFDAYCDRVNELLAAGCRLSRVQLYTIARQTAETNVAPLDNARMDELAAQFAQRVKSVAAEVYYGV
jgi:wyosine [tRNA(Phe)-imidazoG37] synthetase (radical SAM superfamily)